MVLYVHATTIMYQFLYGVTKEGYTHRSCSFCDWNVRDVCLHPKITEYFTDLVIR